QWAGCARFTWNHSLAMRTKAYQRRGETLTSVDVSRHLTQLKKHPDFAWLAACPATVLTQTLRDQDRAFKNFFQGHAHYPRFKKKKHGFSIRFQLDQRRIADIYRPGGSIKIPKLGTILPHWSRIPKGIPKMVTLTKTPDGRYYVSFSVEEEILSLPKTNEAEGIDLNMGSFVLSDGTAIHLPRPLRRLEKKLAHLQRLFSRKRKGSRTWHRTRRKIARLHAKIAAIRLDFLHKLTTWLVRTYDAIGIEDLAVKAMARGMVGGKAVLDVGMSLFRRLLEYKAQWYGKKLVVVDRFFPSTRLCSTPGCGYISNPIPLHVRTWTCPRCGATHQRDVNAARNLKAAAVEAYSTSSGNGEYTRGEAGSGPGAVLQGETGLCEARRPGFCFVR
ncbi:transposase, partial [Candidatus Parcubacteria bacterium]